MQIIKKKDNRQNIAIVHKIADIPNGVTVSVADMTQNVLHEGTPIGMDSNGLAHIIKTAKVATAGAGTTDVTYTVLKGHNFKVGDIIMARTSSKASAISTIATNATNGDYDDITVSAALGITAAVGDVLMQANAATTGTASAFKYAPIAIVGESYDVTSGDSLMVNAWLHAVVYEGRLKVAVSDAIKAKLTNVSFI